MYSGPDDAGGSRGPASGGHRRIFRWPRDRRPGRLQYHRPRSRRPGGHRRPAGAWRLRPGSLGLEQNQRCRRVFGHAGRQAPAGVVMAHRQHRTGDGQVKPHWPRIARCACGDDSGATVGITGMAALARDCSCPPGQVRPPGADHGLPLRPPQHSFAGPLQGQHPPGQRNGQRREAVTGGQPRQPPARQGVKAARAPRFGGVVSALGAPEAALGPWRPPDSRNRPSAERTDRPLAGPACRPTPPRARSRSWSDALGVLRAGQAGCRCRLRSPLEGDLRCT